MIQKMIMALNTLLAILCGLLFSILIYFYVIASFFIISQDFILYSGYKRFFIFVLQMSFLFASTPALPVSLMWLSITK